MANVLKNLNSFQVNIWPHLWFGAYVVVFWPKVVPFVRPLYCVEPIDHQGRKCANLNTKFWYSGPKVICFHFEPQFFQHHILSLLQTELSLRVVPTPQKDQFLRYGLFSGAHPRFWPLLKSSVTQGQLPVILVRYQWKNKNFNGGGRYFGSSKIFLFSEFCFPMSETCHGPKLVPTHNRS